MNTALMTLTITLFLIMDSLGNISSYLTLMKDLAPARKRYVLFREMFIALGVMLFFNFLGEYIFQFLEISETSVRLATGVILFLTAIKILFPSTNSLRSNLPHGEPFITPLAIPLVAGPSLLATIMLYAHMETSISAMLAAIFIAWIGTVIVFLFASTLLRYLGKNGLMACERLTGMILVMIAIQRFAEGIQLFVGKGG
jgi:multiple antibiotic resistance protein